MTLPTAQKQYWPPSMSVPLYGALPELRTRLAYSFLLNNSSPVGLSSGKKKGKVIVTKASDAVAYSFELADAFVREAEARGGIRPFTRQDEDYAMDRAAKRSAESDFIYSLTTERLCENFGNRCVALGILTIEESRAPKTPATAITSQEPAAPSNAPHPNNVATPKAQPAACATGNCADGSSDG